MGARVKMMVIINAGRCEGCGACLAVCPEANIRLVAGRLELAKTECLACGHCQAACPVGAIVVDDCPARLGLTVVAEKDEWLPFAASDAALLVQLMRSRRSCRNYQEKEVPHGLLEDLIRIGTTAPSGTNSQGWTFSLAASRDEVVALGALTADFYKRLNKKADSPFWRLLARFFAADVLGRYYRGHYQTVVKGLQAWEEDGEDHLFHGAPAAILVGGRATASCPVEDALLASQNILLAAHTLGLGSCLIGFVVKALAHDRGFRRQLGLGPGEQIHSVIALGYPQEKYYGLAPRRPITPRYLRLVG